MSTISSQEVISIVKGEIEDYDAHAGRSACKARKIQK